MNKFQSLSNLTEEILRGTPMKFRGKEWYAVYPYKVYLVKANLVDEAWAKDPEFWVGPLARSGSPIAGRYERFQKWFGENDKVMTSLFHVQANGAVGFTNGRHRFAVLRDMGWDLIPVSIPPEEVRNAKKYHYLWKS